MWYPGIPVSWTNSQTVASIHIHPIIFQFATLKNTRTEKKILNTYISSISSQSWCHCRSVLASHGLLQKVVAHTHTHPHAHPHTLLVLRTVPGRRVWFYAGGSVVRQPTLPVARHGGGQARCAPEHVVNSVGHAALRKRLCSRDSANFPLFP